MNLLLSWSIIYNWQRLYGACNVGGNKTSKGNRFAPLHGLRALAMLWTILGHTIYFLTFLGWLNIVEFALTEEDLVYQITTNSAVYAIDIFFFMSALLATYLALVTIAEKRPGVRSDFSEDQKKPFINVPLFYLRRLVRLMPSLVVAVFFYWKISVVLGIGPVWSYYQQEVNANCTDYWWTSVFFLNNWYPSYLLSYYDPIYGCMSWTWYLACEVQYFILLPVVILLYTHTRKWVAWWTCGESLSPCWPVLRVLT